MVRFCVLYIHINGDDNCKINITSTFELCRRNTEPLMFVDPNNLRRMIYYSYK